MGQTRQLTPDRRMVSMDYPDGHGIDPWHFAIDVVAKLDGRSSDASVTRSLHVSPRGNYDYVIEAMHQADVTHRLAGQGGEYILATSRMPGTQGIVLWRGPYHEISSYLPYSVSTIPDQALRRVMGLEFLDSPDGLVVTPDLAGGETVVLRNATVFFEGVGLVEVLPAEQGVRNVPPWAGRRTKAGELWKDKENGADHLILATPRAVCKFSPGPYSLAAAADFAMNVEAASIAENTLTGVN